MQQQNPLSGFFRKPKFFIQLPSKLYYYPDGFFTHKSIEGGIGISAMTGQDELMFKNPDALMNGYAIENAIISCTGAKNPKEIILQDVETILIAIKAATYGDQQEWEENCPNCGEKNEFSVSSRNVLDNTQFLETNNVVELIKNMYIHMKPFDFETSTKQSILMFEQQKTEQMIRENEEKDIKVLAKTLGDVINKMAVLKEELMAKSITKIVLPGGEVVQDYEFILEWVRNIETQQLEILEKKIEDMNKAIDNNAIDVQCKACKHEWKTSFSFNPSSFFEEGS